MFVTTVTIAPSFSAIEAQLADGNFLVIYHAQQAYVQTGHVYSAGAPLGVVGSYGNASGCHIHFEIDGPTHKVGHFQDWTDIDPTSELAWVGSGPAIAFGDANATKLTTQLFATSASRNGGAVWNDSYPGTGLNGWSGFKSLGSPSINYGGVPVAAVFNGQIVVFGIGTDGAMWNYSWSPGCGGSGWCAPWSMPGNGTLNSTSGVAVLVSGNTMQLFAIGIDGALRDYSYSPTQCPTDPAHNGWCDSWSMSGNGPLSTRSGIAALPWNGGMQVFAIGTNGAMRDYSYSPTQCPTDPTHKGWCTAWSMSGNGALSTTSGVAVLPWFGNMQVFAIGTNGAMRDYSYSPTQCPTDPAHNGWCTSWSMSGSGPLSSRSGVAVLAWYGSMQLFAVGTDGAMRDYSYSPTQCPTDPTHNGWCTSWSMSGNGSLWASSGVAVLPWNFYADASGNHPGMLLFAIGTDGVIRGYSYSPTQCPIDATHNGWCTSWSMSNRLGNV